MKNVASCEAPIREGTLVVAWEEICRRDVQHGWLTVVVGRSRSGEDACHADSPAQVVAARLD